MKNRRTQKIGKITPCSNTTCLKKTCINYSAKFIRGSYFFPDCLYNPSEATEASQTK